MKFDRILLRYGELFLKSKPVRSRYENMLLSNIRSSLSSEGIEFKMEKSLGRTFILTGNVAKACDALKKVFGLVSFSPCAKLGLSELEGFVSENAEELAGSGTFKFFVRRVGSHDFTSQQKAARLGEIVLGKAKAKVDVNNPQRSIFVEIRDSDAFVFYDNIPGIGGLPVGTSGKIVSLISGGIDSPVASWMAMKRGCNVVFVHLHSKPFTCDASLEKSKKLFGILSKYQPESKIYLVPFLDVQEEIVRNSSSRFRILLYRRMMLRIAEKIAHIEGAKAVVTGDSLGQVASQTLDNLASVESISSMPLLRPLIGFDKNDIIEVAKRIGTFGVSALQHEDSCTLFAPKHPATTSQPGMLDEIEKNVHANGFLDESIKKAEVLYKSFKAS